MSYFARGAAKRCLLAAAAVLLLSVCAMAAEEDMAVAVGATTGSILRLREEPSTDASVITNLDKAVAVAVLDGSVDGWYHINYNGNVGYVSADYLIIDQDNVFSTYGRATGDGVNVRDIPSAEGTSLAVLEENAVVDVSGLEEGWYIVTTEDDVQGYVRSDYMVLTSSSSSYSGVVDYAMQFLGTRYVAGGASPSGFDCSGFTSYVYGQFGVSLGRGASDQWLNTPGTRIYSIGELQPGDLVYFKDPSLTSKASSHASLYIGNNQIIHASTPGVGVIITDIYNGYFNRYFIGGIRL